MTDHHTLLPFIFTLDEDGVELNMNFICPQCNLALKDHDVEVFTELPAKVKFACPEGEDKAVLGG